MFFTAGSLPAFLLLLAQSTTYASHVETFSDGNCEVSLNDWNGPNGYPNGLCTRVASRGNWTSFKIVDLDPGCAITINGPGTKDGPCDSNAAPGAIVARANRCYNTTWAFYSIDQCIKQETTSKKPTTLQTSTSSTSTTTSPPSTTAIISSLAPAPTQTQAHHDSGVNVGAIVGGVIGGVAFGIIVAAIGIISFIRYRKAKRNRPPEYPGGAPGSSHGMVDVAAKELPSGGSYHEVESRPASVRSAPGTPGGPQELSTEGIPEVPSYPLVELPDRDHAVDHGQKGGTSRMKEGL